MNLITARDLGPDRTLPFGARSYPFPSCGACIRIANKRDLRIGQSTAHGSIEAFSHIGSATVALVITHAGDVATVPIKELSL